MNSIEYESLVTRIVGYNMAQSLSGLAKLLVSLISRVQGLRVARVAGLSLLLDGLSQDVVHQVLQVPGLALLLDPGEHTARQLGEVVHTHLGVEGLEQRVHEDLEHLELQLLTSRSSFVNVVIKPET